MTILNSVDHGWSPTTNFNFCFSLCYSTYQGTYFLFLDSDYKIAWIDDGWRRLEMRWIGWGVPPFANSQTDCTEIINIMDPICHLCVFIYILRSWLNICSGCLCSKFSWIEYDEEKLKYICVYKSSSFFSTLIDIYIYGGGACQLWVAVTGCRRLCSAAGYWACSKRRHRSLWRYVVSFTLISDHTTHFCWIDVWKYLSCCKSVNYNGISLLTSFFYLLI